MNEYKVVTGGVGQGKTLYMSYLAHEAAADYTEIYSNYGLKDSEYFLLEPGAEKIRNAVIAIDEAQNTIPENLNLEDYFGDCLILMTANFKEQIAVKLPEHTKYESVFKADGDIMMADGDFIRIEAFKHLYNFLYMAKKVAE